MPLLEKSEVVEILANAFSPLQCIAELHDYKKSVGLRIYMPEKPNIRYTNPSVMLLQNRPQLGAVITSLRERIEARGVQLAPWSMPGTQGESV